MSIFEYDQEKHMRMEREQAWEEGRAAGLAEGKTAGICEGEARKLTELIRKKLRKGKTVEQIAEELEETTSTIEELIKSM